MISVYCALIFQIITYSDGERIELTMKDSSSHALVAVENLNYFSVEYGHEVKTWGATLKECKELPAEEQLERIGYFVDFDGDGKVCR